MKEKFGLHILSLYANKFLDKLESAFRIDSADLIKVYHKEARNCVNRGRYDETVSLCQKAIKLRQNDAEAHYQLGIAYMGKRLDEEATNSLQKASSLTRLMRIFTIALEFSWREPAHLTAQLPRTKKLLSSNRNALIFFTHLA